MKNVRQANINLHKDAWLEINIESLSQNIIEIKKGINPVSNNKNFKVLEKYKKTINIGLVIDSSNKVFPINDKVYYCPIDIIGL